MRARRHKRLASRLVFDDVKRSAGGRRDNLGRSKPGQYIATLIEARSTGKQAASYRFHGGGFIACKRSTEPSSRHDAAVLESENCGIDPDPTPVLGRSVKRREVPVRDRRAMQVVNER